MENVEMADRRRADTSSESVVSGVELTPLCRPFAISLAELGGFAGCEAAK
jgi:hypothetical protein